MATLLEKINQNKKLATEKTLIKAHQTAIAQNQAIIAERVRQATPEAKYSLQEITEKFATERVTTTKKGTPMALAPKEWMIIK